MLEDEAVKPLIVLLCRIQQQGRGEEGITQLRQGLAAWQATGAGVEQPYFLALLAEGYGKVGQPEEGLKSLAAVPRLKHVRVEGATVTQAGLDRFRAARPKCFVYPPAARAFRRL